MQIQRHSSQHASIRTSSKLNLWLDILGRRADGYHELCSVFHELAFGDELELRLEPAESDAVLFRGSDPALERDPSNLCVRAAKSWLARRADHAGALRIDLELKKHVPAGGGIGGGSGDGVAVLLGLQALQPHALSAAALFDAALELGSDCPFFLHGGTALVRGRGEHVQSIAIPALSNPALQIVLVMPGLHVGTGGVFAAYAAQASQQIAHPELEALLEATDLEALQRSLWNRLEACAVVVEPRLRAVRQALTEAWPYPPAMSGSGSTYFACAADRDVAAHMCEAARRALPSARVISVPAIQART